MCATKKSDVRYASELGIFRLIFSVVAVKVFLHFLIVLIDKALNYHMKSFNLSSEVRIYEKMCAKKGQKS